ncbi:MAG: hypothetical protein WCW77_02645 [Patescibacteria group bacterium]|jgi:hypothetical protein
MAPSHVVHVHSDFCPIEIANHGITIYSNNGKWINGRKVVNGNACEEADNATTLRIREELGKALAEGADPNDLTLHLSAFQAVKWFLEKGFHARHVNAATWNFLTDFPEVRVKLSNFNWVSVRVAIYKEMEPDIVVC